jgi:diadenosine tetraphosphatase ApaH/serine/threonine PP2A family protein phosphatase
VPHLTLEEPADLGAGPVAFFGGVYNNHLALSAVLDDAARRGARRFVCLGDLGGFGPHPDKVFPILFDRGVEVVQGNYDHSVGHALADCGCGYSDPRDNEWARISYAYTLAKTSETHRAFLRTLPPIRVVRLGGEVLRLCHGSPRQQNEFLWESTSPAAFLERLLDAHPCEALLCTHTGIPWERLLASGRRVVNVGAIGRPANDGDTRISYVLARATPEGAHFEHHRVAYDHDALAHEMRAEGLPEEFVQTILTGFWTTCLEVLPAKERARGRY